MTNETKKVLTNTATKTLNNIKGTIMRTIKSKNQTAISELVKQTERVEKPKRDIFVKEDNFIQIDLKSINAEAMNDTLELQQIEESFIPELDTNQQEEFANMLEQRIMELVTEASAELTKVAEEVNKKHTDVIMATTWSPENGNISIKTKYFFTENGLYMQQVTHRGQVTTYKSGVPTMHGLTSYRAELADNEELDFEELRALHNNHVLVINGLEPEEEIYRDLSIVDNTNKRKANFNSSDRKVWVQTFDGFIQAIVNKNETTQEAKKDVKTPTERIADLMNNKDLF